MSKRTPLQEVILANFHPPKFAGGSWTINPEEMEAAVREHIAAEVRRKGLASDLSPRTDRWDAGYVAALRAVVAWILPITEET